MVRKKFVLFVLITLCFISACSPQFDQTQQPEIIFETVIVKVTIIPTPTQIPTEVPAVNQDSFREYAETIFDDLYSNCVGLSQRDQDSNDSSISRKIRSDAEECAKLISTHEIPLNCEYDYECNQLSSLATEYTTLVIEGWRKFEQGEDTRNSDLILEGLGMFWDADLRWLEIRDVIFSLVRKYGWEIHL